MRDTFQGLIIDNFAGGGGASTGIEWALGRSPDVAVNHDPEAVAMHAANHPNTTHLCGDVWEYDPVQVCAGSPVGLGWFSPDCKMFSGARARLSPKDEKVRALAWIVIRWAERVRPAVIMMENVQQFQDWGPLDENGQPDELKRGFTFKRWCRDFRRAGYDLDIQMLKACDYGSPTTRERMFIVAWRRGEGRRDASWPEKLHGPAGSNLLPYRTAAEIIDWSYECPSIFGRDLAEKSLARIARGIDKHVLRNPDPFVVPCGPDGRPAGMSLVQRGWGEREGQAPRVLDLAKPLGTIMAGGIKHALVAAFLEEHGLACHIVQNYGGNYRGSGTSLDEPIRTITTQDHNALVASHIIKLKGTSRVGQDARQPIHTIQASGLHYGEVRAFLVKYNGTDQDPRLEKPLPTQTTKHRFALVTVHGATYAIADIGYRMLKAPELFRGQGFPPGYIIDPMYNGKPLTERAQVKMCGNSVCPQIAHRLVEAHFPVQAEIAQERRAVRGPMLSAYA